MLLKKHKMSMKHWKKFVGSPEDLSVEIRFLSELCDVKSAKTSWAFWTHCFLSSNFIPALKYPEPHKVITSLFLRLQTFIASASGSYAVS